MPLLKRLRNHPAAVEDLVQIPLVLAQANEPHGYPVYSEALPLLRVSPFAALKKWEWQSLKKMFAIHLSDVFLSLTMTLVSVQILGIFESDGASSPAAKILVKFADSIGFSDRKFQLVLCLGVFVFLGKIFAAALHAIKLERESLVSVRIGAQMVPFLYEHILSMSKAERQKFTTGDLVNHAQTDVTSLSDLFSHCYVDFAVLFFSVAAILVALVALVGPAAWAGFALILMQIPFSFLFSYLAEKVQKELMHRSDKRLSLVTEWIQAMRLVRYFGWNHGFFRDVIQLAKRQFRQDIKLNATYCFAFSLSSCWWMVVAVGIFVALGWGGAKPPASQLFGAMWLAGLLGHQLTPLPWFVSTLVKARVASKRLQGVFACRTQGEEWESRSLEDLAPISLAIDDNLSGMGLSLRDVTVKNRLYDVTLEIPPRTKVGILGAVGSGKTTLIETILGEIKFDSGALELVVSGALPLSLKDLRARQLLRKNAVFIPQDAFIFSAEVWENVILEPSRNGQEQDLNEVMNALLRAQMGPDLHYFSRGLHTEIGEKGVNLSGGQKQRVSLSRAFFRRARLVLLDDPISAVDVETEESLLREMFAGSNGWLADATVVCATHRLSVCAHFDHLVILNQGRVVEQGSPQELLQRPHGFYAQMVKA